MAAILLTFYLLTMSLCAHIKMIGQNRIIGGQFAADGGSLIAPDVVLSAAHCAAQPNSRVDIGRTDRNDISDRFENFDNVKEYKHPSYLSISDRYDQMIIKLDGRSTAQTLKLNFDVAVPVSGNALTIMVRVV
jgi:secreted trypsin-like serine protease